MGYSLGICGASGKVGHHLLEHIQQSAELTLSLAVVAPDDPNAGKDVGTLIGCDPMGVVFGTQLNLADKECDIIIDFSHPNATQSCLAACREKGIPLVIGTTGHSVEQQQAIVEAAKHIAILQAANMSVGVNLCLELIRQAVTYLDEDYDIEITEAHHRHKIDAPSGTALSMARAAAEARGMQLEDITINDRTGIGEPRPRGAIGLQVLRGGDLVGEHRFHLIGEGESIEIHHSARSRRIFVQGAIKAALWLLKREQPRLYSMLDIFNS